MPQYLVYGKRTEPVYYPTLRQTHGPDKTFKALNEYGERVTKLSDAFSFASREDAQEFLDAHKHRAGCVFEIRKAR